VVVVDVVGVVDVVVTVDVVVIGVVAGDVVGVVVVVDVVGVGVEAIGVVDDDGTIGFPGASGVLPAGRPVFNKAVSLVGAETITAGDVEELEVVGDITDAATGRVVAGTTSAACGRTTAATTDCGAVACG
jgi:hypothetical protein